jgi:hypothetical protein
MELIAATCGRRRTIKIGLFGAAFSRTLID